ncbi:MAG: ABC transporter ATP-binding protein, partial [Pseudanabaenaceae cyanobacterium bins.68]|nr:ABC transporter ATP-binding protein [Pseudanabaenaceae cyanobacterium bins.68]
YIPLLIRQGIDQLGADFSITQVGFYALAIFGLASLMWMMRMASRLWIFGVGRSVEFDLKQKLFHHVLQLPPSYFAQHSAGDLISISTNDVDSVRRLLGFAILSLVNTIFAYTMTLPAMVSIDLKLTILAILPYPLMFMIVQGFSGTLRDQQLDVQEKLADLSTMIQEDIGGITLIKTYAQEENERRGFNQLNHQLLVANLEMAKTRNFLFPLLGGIASISLLFLLWFGGEMLADPNSGFKIGDLLALLILVERLIFPTALLGFTLTTYQRGQVSIDRVEAVLAEPVAHLDAEDAVTIALDPQGDRQVYVPGQPPSQFLGKIEARDLTFTYPGATEPTLKGVNFTINPGEVVAIIGTVGSGKSTLANALPRLLDLAPGQLFIDGIDLTKVKLQDLRGLITYVPQESFLFSATIANNIRYGDPAAPDSRVEDSARRAYFESEILNFAQKYQTLVGERGITLSGGQRQRTALARALVVDAPILLLDDALSSVDNQTALHIFASLPKQKTVIFITHKLSAAANADRILVMEAGKIVDSGTHSQLLASSELYQKLWNQHQLEQVLT